MLELFDYQKEFLAAIGSIPKPARACLYYRTGAGKTLTAVLGLKELGCSDALVICPPSTFAQWEVVGVQNKLDIRTMSHAKFRMKDTKMDRNLPVVADEMHLFGGQQGLGWRKLDTLARGLKAPMLLLSATPNYNDVERVYCVQHILSPQTTRGGYLQFLYENCITEQNPFSQTPKVTGLKNHPDAEAFLASLPKVFYVPDEAVYDIVDLPYPVELPDELVRYGLYLRHMRVAASWIERFHIERTHGLIGDDRLIRPAVMDLLLDLLTVRTMVFSRHATVAAALARTLDRTKISHLLVTGALPTAEKLSRIRTFLDPNGPQVLIGTSTLATGTDGLDQVCNRLVILDDTDDDALRRQLLGRILPRGASVVRDKEFFRLVPKL